MKSSLGKAFANIVRRWMPEPFVFALILTIIVALCAVLATDTTTGQVLTHWYDGFWMLLEFSMQMVLILVTGFAIALSKPATLAINWIAKMAPTPGAVYVLIVVVGGLLCLVSWGWVVLTAILGRELAKRVEGVDYAYLIALVYFASQPWVGGASSSIPLLLNTPGNFLIESGTLSDTIPTSHTLGSSLNIAYLITHFVIFPALLWWMRPRKHEVVSLSYLQGKQLQENQVKENQLIANQSQTSQLQTSEKEAPLSVAEEANTLILDGRSIADKLNNSTIIQWLIGLCALWIVAHHFWSVGFDLNLNIMIFAFLGLGLLVHRTPMRFGIAMKRACANVSGLVFQYPFYAGIMGIMMFSGLGTQISVYLAQGASIDSLPLIAHFAGASINFAIPSTGGQWAVIGPALTETALSVSAHLPPDQQQAFVVRIAMAVAYGETSTNLLQPFFLLTILPILGAGVVVHARDIIGYLVVPFVLVYTITALLIWFVPL